MERKGDVIEIKHKAGLKMKATVKELNAWMIRQIRKELEPKKELL
jgi:hypothetical protein